MSAAVPTPELLLRRLDELGAALSRRRDAIALIGLGSVGADLGRLDDHSDLDFFVVVEDGAKQRYLDAIDWLEAPCAVSFSFRNTVDGRKALYADGVFAEYAIFTLEELRRAAFTAGRIVWQRDDAPAGLELPARPPGSAASASVDWNVNEALTNLYVGLQRDARGERLSAMRLIQVFAVDRVIALLELRSVADAGARDPFAVERRAESRFGGDALPLAELAPGYERNREGALAVLGWLEARFQVDPVMADAVRALCASPAP